MSRIARGSVTIYDISDGDAGARNAVIYLYRETTSDTVPSAPSATIDWTDGSISGITSGWSLTPPTVDATGTNRPWVSIVTFYQATAEVQADTTTATGSTPSKGFTFNGVVTFTNTGNTGGIGVSDGTTSRTLLTPDSVGASGTTVIDGGRITAETITSLGAVTAGTFSLGSGNFSVDSNGILNATNAVISGNITASTLDVGNAIISGELTADSISAGIVDADSFSLGGINFIESLIISKLGASETLQGDFKQTTGTFDQSEANSTVTTISNFEHNGSNPTVRFQFNKSWVASGDVGNPSLTLKIQRSPAGAGTWTDVNGPYASYNGSSFYESEVNQSFLDIAHNISFTDTTPGLVSGNNYDYRVLAGNMFNITSSQNIPFTFEVNEEGGEITTVGGLEAYTQYAQDETVSGNWTFTGTTSGISYNDLSNKPTLITQTDIDNSISALVDSSPAALDTLNELAAALGDDPNFATTVNNSIATKWTQDNTKISNWDTAYGWGNHAGLYLPLSGGTITGDLSFGSQIGTWITSSVMSDSIGWNSSYGVYIGSNVNGTHYLRGNGTFTTGGSTYSLFHDGYHPNADKWTTARTLSLTGDVTGSVSWDGSANASISTNVTVSSTDTFTGTYPIAWLVSDNLYKCSWLTVDGANDRLNSPSFNATSSYQVNGTTIINSSRNLTNINAISATGTGMSEFSTDMSSEDDWENSPISVRERGLVGSAQSANSYAPNINFHWSGRTSNSLWMNSSGHLNYGGYSSTGTPSDSGTFTTGDVRANVFYDKGDTSTYLEMRGDGGGVRTQTSNGYIDIGAMNTSHAHILTDRSNFYFNKQLRVDTGIISSYNEDLVLRRASSSSHQMTLSTSGATFTGSLTATTLNLNNGTPLIVLKDTNNTGSAQMGYISLKDSTNTEKGWMGYGASTNTDLTIRNSLGRVRVYGSYLYADGYINTPYYQVNGTTVIDASRNLSNIGSITATNKLSISNASYNSHFELVRAGSTTQSLSPSGADLLHIGGNFAPNSSGGQGLGRNDKIWSHVYSNSFQIGTTTVIDSARYGTFAGLRSDGIIRAISTSDAQLELNGNGTTWAGLKFVDSGGTDHVFFYGATKTWAIGGGGSAVSGKKLHIDGGTTIGSNFDSWAAPTNGLKVEGEIHDNRGNVVSSYRHSGSDFANGTLVTTDIPSSSTNGASFVIEVTGKSYSTNPPFSFIAQGYLYNNAIVNYSGVNNGDLRLTYIKAMNNNGYLSFWWPRVSYWNSFEVRVRDAGGSSTNRVTSIANSSDPSGATKKVTINLHKSVCYDENTNIGDLHANNYKIGTTTVIDSSRNLTNINDITANKIHCIGSGANTAPRWDTSFHVVQSQHWYGHYNSQTMYLGESSNKVRIRGRVNIGSDADPQSGYDLSVRGAVHLHDHDINYVNQLHLRQSRFRHRDNTGVDYCADSTGSVRMIFKTGGASGSNRGSVYANSSNQIGFLNTSGNWSLKVDNSGNTTATGNVTAYSDITLKDNITEIDNALEKVNSIRGVTYDRIDQDNARHAGVIAQEVEEVLPEVVHTDDDGIKSVAYGNMVGLLIEAIKEQQAQINELKEELKNGNN